MDSNKYKLLAGIVGTILGLYLIVWGFFAVQFETSKNTYRENLNIATALLLPVQESVLKSPNLWVPLLLSDTQIQKNTNNEIEAKIVQMGKQIKEEAILIAKDNAELDRQINNLGLSDNSPTEDSSATLKLDDPKNSAEVLSIFDKKTEEIRNQELAKARIHEYYLLQKSEGKFANPLWGYTDRELLGLTDNMTNREKAGQFLIFSISEQNSNPSFVKSMTALEPSGIIYMGYNVMNAKQLGNLSLAIQGTNERIPLYIATDQEGGLVKRISWDMTAGQNTWNNMSLEDLCKQAKLRGNILKDVGINLNFSPVVDLTNPNGGFINSRTISANPAEVVEKAQKYVDCLQGEGVGATLKHYPGHGATSEDSHYKLPIIDKTKADWLNSDAIPFKSILNTKAVMLGHLMFTQIDPNEPSTLSSIIVTDILRKEFNYTGLIITDDMDMLHSSMSVGVKEAMQRAVNAGVNQLLYVGYPKTKIELLEILTKMIDSGEVEPVRVQESLLRVLTAKRDII